MKSFKSLLSEISKTTVGNYLAKVTKQNLDKHGLQPNMYDKLSKNRQQGVANAFKRLEVKPVKEDGGGMGVGALSVPGPTNKTGPQSATDPVSATAVNMKKRKKTYATLRRAAPKM